MNVDRAAKTMGAANDIKQFNKQLIVNLTRFIYITDMLYDEYPEDIFEIYVSPVGLLQEQMCDVDKVVLYILYDIERSSTEWKQECEDFTIELFKNEFGKNVQISKPKFITQCPEENAILLKTCMNKPTDRFQEVYRLMYDIINTVEPVGGISISTSFEYEQCQTMILHVTNFSDLIYVDKDLKAVGDKLGKELIAYSDVKGKPPRGSIVYVPVLGLTPLEYDIPYQFYDIQALDKLIVKEEASDDGHKKSS